MKNLFIFLVLSATSLAATAQQTTETKIPVEQVENLGDGKIIIGTATNNTIIDFTAGNMPVVAQNGISSADVQSALEELQGEIIGGGDGWGADVVNISGTILSGNGTVGTPLTVITGNIATSTLNNDAGFITNADDADADPTNELEVVTSSPGDPGANPGDAGDTWINTATGISYTHDGTNWVQTGFTGSGASTDADNSITNGTDGLVYYEDLDPSNTNEAQTISKAGSTVTLTSANGAGGGSFVDEVNDADANATNEAQTISVAGTTATLTDVSGSGGGSFNFAENVTVETFTGVTGASIALSGTPQTGKYIEVKRNGIDQTFATSGAATDATLAGQTLTFNYRSLSASDIVVVKFID